MESEGNIGSPLEDAMAGAIEGDPRAARRFFEHLLEASFYVPERHQDRPLSDAPRYPNDLLNILGINGPGRVVVPVFSRRELIEGWCGAALRARTMRLHEIMAVLPEEWWLCVNPGAAVEKEISPWELGLLRSGSGGIDELIDEFSAENSNTPLEIRPPKPDEYPDLRRGLTAFGESNPEIARLFLLREDGGAERSGAVVVGVECFSSDRTDLDRIKGLVEAEVARGLIGGDPGRVFVGGREDNNFALTIFHRAEPIFVRERSTQAGGVLGRIARLFRAARPS